jgi:putative GTP pyrophosphokinase
LQIIRFGKDSGYSPAIKYMDNMQINIQDFELMEKRLQNLQEFREFTHLYESAIHEVMTKLKILDSEFNIKYAHNPIHHMESRLKSVPSMMGKLQKKGLNTSISSARENLYDIAGIRVICYYIDDIYRIANLLTAQNDITLVRTRNYIAHPKENGYRSLHLVVKVPVFLSQKTELVPVEIQIRTIAMDFWASLEHQLRYKGTETVPDGIPERLARCAETSSMLDLEMQDIYHAINGFGGVEPARLSPQLLKMAAQAYENSKFGGE